MTPEEKNKKNEIVFFAETNFRGQRRKFGIKLDDRRRHMYFIGKTGMGKSTVIENMVIQDIQAGQGVTIIDPHGDLAEKILDFIPSERINDVIYFNPADIDYPIAFNVMEQVTQEHKHLIASGLVGVFKKLWADSWGPRLEYVLRNAILALLDYPSSTLLGVMRILVDKNFRKKVIAKIKDPVVRAFWVEEYSRYPTQFQVEAVAPIQNKVGQFLSTALIRNIVGQVKSTIDLRKVMDESKILVMNLSKGRIGEDASALLGAMMITKLQLAAMSRIDVPEEKRIDFYLYVDELQNFATESFADILSEARKYRLNLVIAHQYIGQLIEDNNTRLRDAIFGNVGTIICFRVGAADAEFLVLEFTPYFTEDDLVNLTKYEVYIKLMIDGVSSAPFSAITLPPLTGKTENKEKIIRACRERYAKPREIIEEKIARWSGMTEEEDLTEEPKKFKDKKVYRVNCYECGKLVEVPFQPDGVRPVYCKECFRKIREGALRTSRENQLPPEEIEEERKTKSSPEIPLKEILKREPQSFSPTSKIKQGTKNKENKTFVNSELMSKTDPILKNKQNQTSSPKILKPGQVIKF